jgi:YegS/Rv2252/BmrU family lipid kinase
MESTSGPHASDNTDSGARRWGLAGRLLLPLRRGARLLALLARYDLRRLRTVTRAGRWTLRYMRWRETARGYIAAAHEVAARARSGIGVAFKVVAAWSSSPIRSSDAVRLLEAEWKPPVAARARIVVNPTSGSVRGMEGLRELRETARWLTDRGLPTELTLTRKPRHATDLAREAVRAGMEMVIAAGGDGTLNDVVQGLAGTAAALGVLPMGTVNVWARETGIPLNNVGKAREVLLRGVQRRVDLGRAGTRYFLLMADVGFGAEVIKRVERNWLKRWGLKLLDYAATAGMLGLTQQPAKLWVRVNGKRHATRALMVIVGNTRLYAGALTFTERAIADDGWLDVVIIGDGGLVHRTAVIGRALLRRPAREPRERALRCRSIVLESSPPLPVQVDGELVGRLPMTFSLAPGALTVIVPPGSNDAVFSRPPLT